MTRVAKNIALNRGNDSSHGVGVHARRCPLSCRVQMLAAACAVAACTTFEPPKPWEKGDLARPSMRFDADPLATRVTQHIYQSKEGAAGGGAVGGGGCGCN